MSLINHIAIVSAALLVSTGIAQATPVAHPAIPEIPASSVYQVRIDGKTVPVNDEGHFDFHTAFFSMGKPVTVEVDFAAGAAYESIHPLRHGIKPEIAGNKISFTLAKPLKLVIKARGNKPRKPLLLCATPLEENVPAAGDANVIYFGPGVHEPGVIKPVSGQTVYLASGALVKGRIEVRRANGVSIRGRGTLDARGFSVRADKTHAVLFERCKDVHLEGIGIRGGTWWQTLFLLTNDASATHLNVIGKTVNTDGIDIDGVKNFVARDCFIRCEDDGFGWHAVDAEVNGQPPTENALAEDCVIWNTTAGNGLRVGASMETELFQNITFRNIDVLAYAGSAIHADHSDWATCRNIRFENFFIESSGGKKGARPIDIAIAKTRYSNSTGFRDERGHFDGLEFIKVTAPSGGIRLSGFDAEHRIENVLFRDCAIGGKPIDSLDDIEANEFVRGVKFEIPAKAIAPGELNLGAMLQPVPLSAKFINDSSYIWCGSLVKSHIDQKYHLFYSRWPREHGFTSWVTRSEIAHAVANSPFGPFEFKDVTLPFRGPEFWDGMYTHNPTIQCFKGKYYLYYTGNFGDGKITHPKLNMTHRNNQRIGVAIADNPNGPWKRFDKPIIDVSSDPNAHDAQMVANPSVTQMPDGRFLMVYKSVARKKPQPSGGPVVHLTAISEHPEGPFVKQNKPIFTAENVDFPAEDPYVWYQDGCYYAIVKDMKGAFTAAGRSLVLFYSLDGLDWKLAKHPLVSDLNLKWADGTTQKLEALERPQLFFENGKLVSLLCAAQENHEHSFNVQIPLMSK